MEKTCHSKLSFLSALRKRGPLVAFILMLTLLLALIYMMHTTYVSLPNLIRSNPFIRKFQYPSVAIHRWYFLGTMFIVISIPYTVIARCLSHRKTPLAYWSFVIPTVAFYLYWLIIWTIPFSCLIQYINTMGSTSKRIHGLWYSLGGYIVILGFMWWIVRKPKEKDTQPDIGNMEEKHSALLKESSLNSAIH